MGVLKFPLLKQRAARKSASAHLHPKPDENTRPTIRAKSTLPSLLSTLRLQASSVNLKLLANGRIQGLKKRPSQKRRIIHVATLNFGPFEDFTPEFAASLSSRNPPSTGLLGASKQDNRIQESSTATPASWKQLQESRAPTLPAAGISASATVESVYSRDSWVEVSVGYAQRATMIISASSSGETGNETETGPDCEIAGGAGYSHAGEITTSSINEESFRRIAEAELGW